MKRCSKELNEENSQSERKGGTLAFARSIAKGQETGEISRDIDAASTARELLAMFLGLRVLSRSWPEPELLQTIADQAERGLG